MIRPFTAFVVLISYHCLGLLAHAAEPPIEPDARATRALAINAAMLHGKELLAKNRPEAAVAALEAQILYVNGNPVYLALLKESYLAYYKQLMAGKGSAERLEHVQRQLRILDPQWNPGAVIAPVKADAPVVEEADIDPFQQAPLDRKPMAVSRENCDNANAAFERKQYPQAAAFFAQAVKDGIELAGSERSAWGYCRLHAIASILNKPEEPATAWPELEREAQAAMVLGGEALQKFGNDVLAGIHKRQSLAPKSVTAALPEGWHTADSANFRVIYRENKDHAEEVLQRAEEIRLTTFKKWSGAAGGNWDRRCDIHLHESASDYAKSTHKPAESPGHSSIGVKGNVVMARRIDLRHDDEGMIECTLPKEVAFIVLSDLFAVQPLPRWADVGMTTLAQPSSQISRYVRAVPKLSQDKKLFKVADLLRMTDYPEAGRITAFYAESVSLVDYLVKLKGPAAFALYLREAPRRGYEEALQRHYGFRDAAELQEGWLKHIQNGD